jgi:hypothetical protein
MIKIKDLKMMLLFIAAGTVVLLCMAAMIDSYVSQDEYHQAVAKIIREDRESHHTDGFK